MRSKIHRKIGWKKEVEKGENHTTREREREVPIMKDLFFIDSCEFMPASCGIDSFPPVPSCL